MHLPLYLHIYLDLCSYFYSAVTSARTSSYIYLYIYVSLDLPVYTCIDHYRYMYTSPSTYTSTSTSTSSYTSSVTFALAMHRVHQRDVTWSGFGSITLPNPVGFDAMAIIYRPDGDFDSPQCQLMAYLLSVRDLLHGFHNQNQEDIRAEKDQSMRSAGHSPYFLGIHGDQLFPLP